MRGFLLLFVALPSCAFADDYVNYSFEPEIACLAKAEGLEDALSCIGLSVEACIENTEGGYSNMAMKDCTYHGLQEWDERLNHYYALRMSENTDFYYSSPEEYRQSLRVMQSAWITYRDTKCAHTLLIWDGGTGGPLAWLGCMMNMTAEQALYLEYDGFY